MPDKLETIGHSLVQHGPENDRIYLMKASPRDGKALPSRLHTLASRKGYSKIFAKVPAPLAPPFLESGYREEAAIPNYYQGRMTCHLLAQYLDEARATPKRKETRQDVLHTALKTPVLKGAPDPIPDGHIIREMKPEDARAMAAVYRQVFASYPFPIHDPSYLKETMDSHIRYFGVFMDDALIALSSCELDREANAVEMTDFATLPACRGKGLAVKLLYRMEDAMREDGLQTTYTIARAVSHGMNITFAKLGYTYAGTLINNTQISGRMESMNVWFKPILKL